MRIKQLWEGDPAAVTQAIKGTNVSRWPFTELSVTLNGQREQEIKNRNKKLITKITCGDEKDNALRSRYHAIMGHFSCNTSASI